MSLCKAIPHEWFFRFAYIYEKLGKIENAVEICQRCYSIRYRVLGREHPQTIKSLLALADNYEKMGKTEDEETLLEEAVAVLEKIYGVDDKETINVKDKLLAIKRLNWQYFPFVI